MKIKVDRCRKSDILQVAELILTNFEKEVSDYIPELDGKDDIDFKKFINYYIQMEKRKIPHCVFVAKDGDKVIGASGGHLNVHHWGKQVWGTEDYWFIKKEYRGGTAGARLYKMLQKWFKESGCSRIQMTHYTWAPEVGELYIKDGYKAYDVNYVKINKERKNGS